ncbi:SRPBCC family protein [Streptomyces sp. NPDC048710]|uniref:SRPBCC family protein n=1 Tax=Streptomyces sp. NPDC048710 TaxID=3365586 RepID=UPI00371F3F8B
MKVTHTTAVRAPAAQVRELVADVRWWPLLFENIVHVEVLARSDDADRLRLWAVDVDAAFAAAASTGRDTAAPGVLRSWTARRTFGRTGVPTIAFRQEAPQPPLLSMGGTWEFRAVPGTDTCEVTLTHEVEADGGTDRHPWVRPMVEGATDSQLAGLRAAAHLPYGIDRSVADLSAAVDVHGGTAAPHDVLANLDTLPATSDTLRVPLAPDAFLAAEPGRRGFRLTVCLGLPGGRVVTKRLRPPAALLALVDEWTVNPGTGSAGGPQAGVHRRALLSAARHGRPGHDRVAERLRSCLAADARDRLQRLAALSTVAA